MTCHSMCMVAVSLAALTLIGWATGLDALRTFGLAPVTSPWSAVMLGTLAWAAGQSGRLRRVGLGVAGGMAAGALLVPEIALQVQQVVVSEATSVTAPGTASATLLLLAAASQRARCATTSVGLVLASAALAAVAVVGHGAGWAWAVSAGSPAVGAGMALPTILIGGAAAVSVLVRPDEVEDQVVLWALRRGGWLMSVAALSGPALGLIAADDVGRAGYVSAAAVTGLLVVLAARARQAGDIGEGLTAIEALLDVAPDAMLVVDRRGRVLRANERMASLSGWELDQLRGGQVDALVPTVARQVHRQRREAFVRAGRTRPMGHGADVTLARADGTAVPVTIALAPVQVAGREVVIATVRDASAQRAAEDMVVRLEGMRELFLSSVSHELRTPITVIRGLATTMVEHELDAEIQRELTTRLARQAGRLEVLVEDLLNLQKLEADARLTVQRLTATDVAELVRRVLPAGVDRVVVEVDDDGPDVLVNQTLLERAISNLLTNAAKYAPGPVEMRIAAVDDGLCIAVDDHGHGVPHGLRDAVFEPFSRGTAADSAAPGVGIGLSLVAGVAAASHGRAWATSRDDGQPGASFRMWLPAAPPDDRRDGPPERREEDEPVVTVEERRYGPPERRHLLWEGPDSAP